MDLFQKIARLYEEDLRVPDNSVCRLRCDARVKRPLLPWHIGELYESDPRRVVLIGRPRVPVQAMGETAGGRRDGREAADRLYRTARQPFWRYARKALERVFGSAEEGWKRVALTTLVKCAGAGGGTEDADGASETMKTSCIREVGAIRWELAILNPGSIVICAGKGYDRWLDHLCWSPDQRWRDLSARSHVRVCGTVPIPWWEREIVGGRQPARLLRLDDPRGRPMKEYVEMLSDWLMRPRSPGTPPG